MSEKLYHTIELNLPAVVPTGELPLPDKPPVTIDGIPFPHVTNVSLKCGSENSLTEVTVTFYAEVKGVVRAKQTRTMPAPPEFQGDPGDENPGC